MNEKIPYQQYVDGEMGVKKMKEAFYQSKCPQCGNIDVLSEREIKRTVHCQCCYFHYEYSEEKKKEDKEKFRQALKKVMEDYDEALRNLED